MEGRSNRRTILVSLKDGTRNHETYHLFIRQPQDSKTPDPKTSPPTTSPPKPPDQKSEAAPASGAGF